MNYKFYYQLIGSLKSGYELQLLRNLRIIGQLREVLNTFCSLNVPVILLKGAFLAERVYEDIALRPMMDIDLLCQFEDVEYVKKALFKLGYHQMPRICQSDFHAQIMETNCTYHHVLLRSQYTRTELHVKLFPETQSFPSEERDIWRTATPLVPGKHCMFGISPEYQVLQLAHHLCKHIRNGAITLYWLCDIHEVIDRYPLRWDKLAAMASRLGISSCNIDLRFVFERRFQRHSDRICSV